MPVSHAENIDCMQAMKGFGDKFFELAIVDPPYGIGYCRTGTTYTKGRGGKNFTSATHYEKKDWDEAPPLPEYFAELIRVSRNQIIWGGNHFQLEPSRGWVYWDKKIANATTENYSDGELAWTSFDRVIG